MQISLKKKFFKIRDNALLYMSIQDYIVQLMIIMTKQFK